MASPQGWNAFKKLKMRDAVGLKAQTANDGRRLTHYRLKLDDEEEKFLHVFQVRTASDKKSFSRVFLRGEDVTNFPKPTPSRFNTYEIELARVLGEAAAHLNFSKGIAVVDWVLLNAPYSLYKGVNFWEKTAKLFRLEIGEELSEPLMVIKETPARKFKELVDLRNRKDIHPYHEGIVGPSRAQESSDDDKTRGYTQPPLLNGLFPTDVKIGGIVRWDPRNGMERFEESCEECYCLCMNCASRYSYHFHTRYDHVTVVICRSHFSRRFQLGTTNLNIAEIIAQTEPGANIEYDVVVTVPEGAGVLAAYTARYIFVYRPCATIQRDPIEEFARDTQEESSEQPGGNEALSYLISGSDDGEGSSGGGASMMDGVIPTGRPVSSACGWCCAVAIDEGADALVARVNARLLTTRYATSIIGVDILFAYLELGVLLPNVCESFFAARDLFDPTFAINGRLQELIRRHRGTAAPATTPAGAVVAGPAADDGAGQIALTWMKIRDAVRDAERTGGRLHETILRHATQLPPVDTIDMQEFLNTMGHEFHEYIPQWEELMEFDRRSPTPTHFAFKILEHTASPANTMDEASYELAEALINMIVASNAEIRLCDRLADKNDSDAEDSDDEPESWVGLVYTVVNEGNAAFLRCFLTHDETREVAVGIILNELRGLVSTAVGQLNNVYGADDEEMPHLAIVKLLLETIARNAPEGVEFESELEVKRAFQDAAFEALDNWADLDELMDDLWEYLIMHPRMDLTLDGDALWNRVLEYNRAQAMVALMQARASRGLPDITTHVAELALAKNLWATWRALKQPLTTSAIHHALTNWREQDAESAQVQMLMFLDCGFDFNATINEDGETLLHVFCDHEFLLPVLLACGADPSKRDLNGRTPAERLAATMASPPEVFTALLTSQVDLAPQRAVLLRAAAHLCYDRAVAFLSARVDWGELPAEPVMGPGSAPVPLLLLPLHNFKPADGPIAHVQRVSTFATLIRRADAIDPVALQRNQAAIEDEYHVQFVEPVSVTYERVLNEGAKALAWQTRSKFSRPFRGRVRALFVLYQGNSLLAQLPLELLFALLEVLVTLEYTLPPAQPLTMQDRQQWLSRTECLLYKQPTMSQRALQDAATGLVRNLVDQICPAATTSEVQRVRDFLATGPAAVKPVDARLPPTVAAAAPQPSEPQQPSTTGGDTAAPSAGVTAGASDSVPIKTAAVHVQPLRVRMRRVHAFVNQVVAKVSGVGDADEVRAILDAEWTAALDIDVALLAEMAA